MKQRANERITETIIKQLEANSAPIWSMPWRTMAKTFGQGTDGPFPANHVSGKSYSGVNILLLWSARKEQGFSRNRWMTFKQAKAKGGSVRKGERGTSICFASTYKKESDRLDAQGQPMLEDRNFLKTYTVFNLDQIDGLDESAPPETTSNPLRMEDFDAMIDTLKVKLVHGGNRACYMHEPVDMIKMPFFAQFKGPDLYYAVLGHELTHWTGAKCRLDRTKGKRFGDKNYAFEELIAELGATFLCAEYGIDHTSQATTYLASWLKGMKDHPQMIISAASQASKAVNFIRDEVLAAHDPLPMPSPAAVKHDVTEPQAVQAEMAF